MISFEQTEDLNASAQITYDNMQSYYQHYGVDWKLATIRKQISDLENWDILFEGLVVGAIRLAYDESGCYLRDLQVVQNFQGRGIGSKALNEVSKLAIDAGVDSVRLRVFKISPAQHLYQRQGFVIDKEEDRFYYMSRPL